MDDLHSKIDPSIPIVLAGDYNTVFDRSIDHLGYDPADSSCESSSSLRDLFDTCCVIDIWRYLHPSSSSFTWTRCNGSLASRIDLFGVPYVWVSSVPFCDILLCPFSDHCAVSLSISVPDVVPPGPGLWKLNISILDEVEYVKNISDFWQTWHGSIQQFPSLAKWWEAGKSHIKGLSIRYCCSRSSEHSCNRDLLVRLIEHLKARVDSGSSSCLEPYHSALSDLAVIDSCAAKGAQVRSHVRWIEEGESSSANFFHLEKKCSADRWISALREDDGSIISSPDELCRCFVSFYSSLFTAAPMDPVVQVSFLGKLSSTLDQEQAALCEVSSCPRNVLQRFMVWLGARLQAWMACLWNFMSNSGMC